MENLDLMMETITVQDHQQPVTTQVIVEEWEDKLVYDFDVNFLPNFHVNSIDINDQNLVWERTASQQDSVVGEEDTKFLASIIDSLDTQQILNDNFNDQDSLSPASDINSSIASIPVGAAPEEPSENTNLACVQQILATQSVLLENGMRSKRSRHATVVPAIVDYQPNGGCKPYNDSIKQELDQVYLPYPIQFDAEDPKKIQIKCQPRGKFRPRTQNESRISSHYIRCEEGVKPEYPTVQLKTQWFAESQCNIIEVALVTLEKESHPYSLENRLSTKGYQKDAMIFKEQENNIVYFLLTNEDFKNGYKTFQVEYIKARQDEVITKEAIRKRKLDQSMLRFTRIYELPGGDFTRDVESEVYSTVMIEAYGDIEVEHMGPRMGPMLGEEMIYGVLKGRVLKNELNIEVVEETSGWHCQVTNFTKNGNVIYFKMPAFPYPEMVRVVAHIIVNCRGEELFRMAYIYKNSFDEELANLSLNDSPMGIPVANMQNTFDAFDFLSNMGPMQRRSPKRQSISKRAKRLSGK